MTLPSPSEQTRTLRRLFLTIMMRSRRQKNGRPVRFGPGVQFALSLVLFSFLGLVALALPAEPFLFASCLHSLAFVIVGLNLATSSGQLLFNPEEAEVLLHRPISARALLLAKLQTLGMVSLAMALSLSLAGLVLGAVRSPQGWLFVPAHLISLLLEVLFATSLIVLIYNLCLRWFGKERLDNLMTTVQVAAAVLIMLAGQIVPRLLQSLDTTATHLPVWFSALPPVWFGALDLLLGGHANRDLWPPAALGIAVTAAVTWLGVVQLAGTYAAGLEKLNEADGATRSKPRRTQWLEQLRSLPVLNLWLRDEVEFASFRLGLAYLGRSRGIKLRVYPMLAQLLVIPLVAVVGGAGGQFLQVSKFLLPYVISYIGFFLAMIPVMVLEIARISEDSEAAVIFRQAPLARPSALFHGFRKAVLLVLCIPPLLVFVAGALFLLSDKTQLLLLLPGLMMIPISSLLPALFRLYIPFSDPAEAMTKNLKTALMIVFFQFFSVAMAGATGWLWGGPYFLWYLVGEIVIVALVSAGLRTTIQHQTLLPE